MTRIAQHSDIGPRDNLEDAATAFIVSSCDASIGDVAVVLACDGVGGKNCGEVASMTAIRRLVVLLSSIFATGFLGGTKQKPASDGITSILERALRSANEAILQEIEKDGKLTGMATTVVCAVIVRGILIVGWAGDSRCYLYRNGSIKQLTTDHSEVQALVEEGLISSEEAKTHPLAHTITNYLGKGDFKPSIAMHRLRPGDVLVLCTDGLTDVLADADIAEKVWGCMSGAKGNTFRELPQALVDQALAWGTQDNVTVLCCAYEPAAERSPETDRTMTDSYRFEMAEATQHLFKECQNARENCSSIVS